MHGPKAEANDSLITRKVKDGSGHDDGEGEGNREDEEVVVGKGRINIEGS